MTPSSLMASRLWLAAGWTMLHFLWAGAALGMLAAVGRWRLRGDAPEVRHAFALTCLAALAVAPALIAPWALRAVPAAPPPAPAAVGAIEPSPAPDPARLPGERLPAPAPGPAAAPVPPPDAAPPPAADRPEPPDASPRPILPAVAAALPWVWLAGAPLTFALIATGLAGAGALRRQALLLESGPVAALCRRLAGELNVARAVAVGVCPRLAVPLLLGIARPLILLPAAALTGWSPAQLQMVLLHELAHVRRRDNLVNLLQRVAEGALFFHPVVWWVSAWVRLERECCCDRAVLAHGGQPRAYAEALARLALPAGEAAPAGVAMARNNLVVRIRRILNLEEQSMQVSRTAVALTGALLLVPILLLAAADRPAAPGETTVTPAPLDGLDRSQIPAYELKAAGNGDPAKAPDDLVAVLGSSRLGHADFVRAVAYTPDGKTLVTMGDSTVRLWDPATGEQKRVLQSDEPRLHSMALSRDGRLVAAGGDAGPVQVWDAATGAEKSRLKGHKSWVSALAFAPGGKTLASASEDGTVKLWDPATGKEQQSLAARDEVNGQDKTAAATYPSRLAFSPDGRTLVTACPVYHDRPTPGGGRNLVPDEGLLLAWDATTGKKVAVLKGHTRTPRLVAFSPDGKTLFSGGEDAQFKVWDAATWKELAAFQGGESEWALDIAFSPDGKTAALSMGLALRLIDPATGKEQRRFADQKLGFVAIAFSPDGKRLAGVGTTIRFWDVASGKERPLPSRPGGAVKAVAFSPDGKTLAAGSEDGTVKVWDLLTRQPRHILRGHEHSADAVAFSPDGKTLASGDGGGTVYLWEAATGKKLRSLSATTWVRSLAFSPDGQMLAGLTMKAGVELWDPAGAELRTLEGGTEGNSVAFSPDGRTVAGHGMTWDAFSGVAKLRLDRAHGPLALSPDGLTLAAGSPVKLRDAAKGEVRATLEGHSGYVTSVIFSRDGKKLATSASDGTVRLWDADKGTVVRIFPLAPSGSVIAQVVFSPDGRYLASANANGTVSILRLAPPPKK